MARRSRNLIHLKLPMEDVPKFQAEVAEQLALCPEAAVRPPDEVEDFLAAAQYLDSASLEMLLPNLRRARIAYPPDLAVDRYRLGYHLLHRWNDAALREAFLRHVIEHNWNLLARIKRTRDIPLLLQCVDEVSPPVTFSILRRHGMGDLIGSLRAALPEHQQVAYDTLVLYGRLLWHRFVTEPEPPRRPSRWEKQKLEQRLRLRDVQVHSLRKNLVKLRRERKRLLSHLREAGRKDPQLDTLARELEQVREQAAEAERRHAAALEAQAERYRQAIESLQAQVAAAGQEYRETLMLRSAWLPPGGR